MGCFSNSHILCKSWVRFFLILFCFFPERAWEEVGRAAAQTSSNGQGEHSECWGQNNVSPSPCELVPSRAGCHLGEFTGPFSMAGTLLGEPARLFAHLAWPGLCREDGWAEMREHRGTSCFLPIFH